MEAAQQGYTERCPVTCCRLAFILSADTAGACWGWHAGLSGCSVPWELWETFERLNQGLPPGCSGLDRNTWAGPARMVSVPSVAKGFFIYISILEDAPNIIFIGPQGSLGVPGKRKWPSGLGMGIPHNCCSSYRSCLIQPRGDPKPIMLMGLQSQQEVS